MGIRIITSNVRTCLIYKSFWKISDNFRKLFSQYWDRPVKLKLDPWVALLNKILLFLPSKIFGISFFSSDRFVIKAINGRNDYVKHCGIIPIIWNEYTIRCYLSLCGDYSCYVYTTKYNSQIIIELCEEKFVSKMDYVKFFTCFFMCC